VPFNGKDTPLDDVMALAGEPFTTAPGVAAPLGLRGGMTAITPTRREPVLPEPTTNAARDGSFEDYMNAPPERRAEIEAARKRYMQSDDRPRVTVQTGAGSLPAPVQRRVDAKASAFDRQPVVKKIQPMAEAVAFAESMDVNTKNPADDQALIYAFAKAMDPESVVREGEYATVQKYSQNWVTSFGFNAQRVVANTEILTPQARQQLRATIRQKYTATKKQYDNVRRSYVSQINRMTSGANGDDYLIDYAGGFPDVAPPPAASAAAKEGDEREIPNVPGGVARFQGGKWVRIK
jgi:hypothetical protein